MLSADICKDIAKGSKGVRNGTLSLNCPGNCFQARGLMDTCAGGQSNGNDRVITSVHLGTPDWGLVS